jgi:cell division protein FtsI (penicillin-binding protein 3)
MNRPPDDEFERACQRGRPNAPRPGAPIPPPRSAAPRSAQPRTTQPRTTQPRTTQPRTTQPRTTQPRTTQPRTTQPRTTHTGRSERLRDRPTRPGPRRTARAPRRPIKLGQSKSRLTVGLGVVCVLLAVVTVQLVRLQGFGFGHYAAAAAEERTTTVELNAARGSIVDRNGVVLAYTADAKDIVADPSAIKQTDRLAYAIKLSPLSGVPVVTLLSLLAKPGEYALLAQAIQPGPASQIDDLNLAGIYVEPTTQRLYPGGTTAANVVGLVHSDGTGAAGIEQQFNSLLRGKNGTESYQRTADGSVNPAGVTKTIPAVNGGTVKLTISQDLQYYVQQQLDTAVAETKARGGEVEIQDVKTGQVLALASANTFNASDPSTINADTVLDAPVQSVYEPGSVNKVVTFSAALAKSLINPTSIFSVPTDISMGGVVVHDDWWHKTQRFTSTGILAESSNVGTLEIAQKVGPDDVDKYLKAYGLGVKTGIELPGESAGILPPMSDWSQSTFANLPIGQGVAMTILQMTSMYQTIANNGLRIEPRIVSSVTNADGSVTQTKQPAGVQVTTVKTAATLRTMLEQVMMPGGTGTKAAIPGYRIAGKTGTAQQPDPKTGKYSDTIQWDTFAGIAPADKPAFVIGIMIDNPAKSVNGGDIAAPLYKQIASYVLQHDNIPPTGSLTKPVTLTLDRSW